MPPGRPGITAQTKKAHTTQNAPAELTGTLRVGMVEPLFFSDFLKSTRGIVDVLKYSGGLSFLPEFAVRHDLRHGNLKVIECDLPPVPLTVTVAAHREKWISPQMQGMIQLLSSEPWL